MSGPSSNPHPIPLTESEVLIRGFLAANPSLDISAESVTMMTDRYTNEEWTSQIEETVKNVMKEVESGERAKKLYEGPRMRNGDEALKELAKTVDHTVLKLDATSAVVDGLCSEARTEDFKSVCVRLNWVHRCVSNLKGSDVLVACVVGFHEGTHDTHSKLREAHAAVAAGAAELDVVLNHAILTKHNNNRRSPSPKKKEVILSSKDSAIDSITAANTVANAVSTRGDDDEIPDYSAIYTELATIRSLCPSPIVLKLILETSQLNAQQILAASHLAASANFDFIKTSTGFNGPGASLPNVQLMVAAAEYLSSRGVGRRKMQVKASGGVRDLDTAIQMLEAGATRLGTSSGLWIMQEARKKVGEDRGRGLSVENLKVESRDERPGGGLTRLYTDESSY